jgi:hypothetical protein
MPADMSKDETGNCHHGRTYMASTYQDVNRATNHIQKA